jgi:hypothetical protein
MFTMRTDTEAVLHPGSVLLERRLTLVPMTGLKDSERR